jgi:CSLREA domain-containing protein
MHSNRTFKGVLINVIKNIRICVSLFIILFFQIVLVQSADAVTFNVTKFNDTNDGTCDTDCSLREAVGAANANSNSPTVDTINLPTGIYSLTLSANGDLIIDEDVEIIGLGSTPGNTVVDAGGPGVLDYRVFRVVDTVATFRNLTVTGGNGVNGGGDGGGIEGNDSCTITIEDVIITGNNASDNGGGISNEEQCVMLIINSTIGPNNSAGNRGGGIRNSNQLTIVKSTISGNDADDGGGISNEGGGTITIINSTISGNDVNNDGGGIFNRVGSIIIRNSTITDNDAISNGGGIENTNLDNANSVDLMNTIVAGNTEDGVIDDSTSDCSQELPITSNGFNIVGIGTGCPSNGTGDITVDPALVCTTVLDCTLADNGGPTETHALLSGSPAIDMGDPAGCEDPTDTVLDEDQRSFARPVGGACDIGAFESQTIIGPIAPSVVPTLSEWGLIIMAGILGLIGVLAVRRRLA